MYISSHSTPPSYLHFYRKTSHQNPSHRMSHLHSYIIPLPISNPSTDILIYQSSSSSLPLAADCLCFKISAKPCRPAGVGCGVFRPLSPPLPLLFILIAESLGAGGGAGFLPAAGRFAGGAGGVGLPRIPLVPLVLAAGGGGGMGREATGGGGGGRGAGASSLR